MKVLLITIEPPLPFAGAASKWFYVLLKGLRERGHDVTCLSVCSKPKDLAEARRIFPDETTLKLFPFPATRSTLGKKIASLIRPYSYMFSTEFKEALANELQKGYDVIHLEQLWAGWVIPREHLSRALINIHHLVMIDLEETRKAHPREVYEYMQTARAEKKLVKKFRFRRFFTPRLLEKSSQFISPNPERDRVIPFSVDFSLYTPSRLDSALTVGMIASMGWYPGRSAALNLLNDIFPRIRKTLPECSLRIAGWNARSVLQSYVGIDGVEILENIPDVEAFFNSLSVFVYIPSRGSGMKIKVIEAMLYGIPVVTTVEGLEGLPAEDGVHALIAKDNTEAAACALRLLESSELRTKLARNARRMVGEHCEEKKVLGEIESLYQTMLSR